MKWNIPFIWKVSQVPGLIFANVKFYIFMEKVVESNKQLSYELVTELKSERLWILSLCQWGGGLLAQKELLKKQKFVSNVLSRALGTGGGCEEESQQMNNRAIMMIMEFATLLREGDCDTPAQPKLLKKFEEQLINSGVEQEMEAHLFRRPRIGDWTFINTYQTKKWLLLYR
ncbi:MAG: hypothetical protein EZS28_026004 [Streblomastix strix]|uniref:Uncharacterized protein n=1 Tax=Streblomastix strix TaxID=222440 RepID=A0A5J4V7T0_9EUKA|nr:MAG: hypothetical protein EZS28_026004 [Streblomastix strix]